MTKDELINAQQLEIENHKIWAGEAKCILMNISNLCACVSGPLSDNIKGYTHEQIADFQYIHEQARFVYDKRTQGK